MIKKMDNNPQLYIITDSLVSECSKTATSLPKALDVAHEMVEFRRKFLKEEQAKDADYKWIDDLVIECTIDLRVCVSRGTENRRVHLLD